MATINGVGILTIINGNPKRISFSLAFLLLGIFLFPKIAGWQTPACASTNQRPKLVVFLIADQFPVNFILHCADKFQANGFRQLIENGANFSACRYEGSTNQTACNLASITAGAYPWATGVIANEWFDHHKQKSVRAVLDDDKQTGADLLGLAGSVPSPFCTTIGDELKIATNGLSRVISVSTSRSDALLLAGKSRDQAYWWDTKMGNFCGYSHLSKNVPAWVNRFNEKSYSSQFLGKTWTSSGHSALGSDSNYDNTPKTEVSLEKNVGHSINMPTTADESFYTQFAATPWANQMLVEFATEAINEESLGQHDTTDILNISFPAFESVGRNYGPYSQASHDLVWQFDQSLSDLLQTLDQKIGLSNCLIIFTACHGAMPSPAMMQAQGMESGVIDAKSFRNQLNTALSLKLGKSEWIEAFAPPNLYLNLNAIDHSSYHQPDVEKISAKLARGIPGVAEIYTAFQFFMNQVPIGPQVEMVRKSYFWGRSGELYIIPKPGFIFSSSNDGIIAGSPYSYDAQVPLFILGGAIKAGNYASPVSPVDIAPTVANILNISAPPLSEGRVLNEALNSTSKGKYPKSVK